MEYLMIAFLVVIIYIFAFKRGYEFREKEAVKKIHDTIDRMEEELIESVIKVELEKVDDVVFVYNAETNEFMAQGKDQDEIAKILKVRYPGKRFAAKPESLRAVGFPDE